VTGGTLQMAEIELDTGISCGVSRQKADWKMGVLQKGFFIFADKIFLPDGKFFLVHASQNACNKRRFSRFDCAKIFFKKLLRDKKCLILFSSLRGNNRYEGRCKKPVDSG
jgi:hypothetical protein